MRGGFLFLEKATDLPAGRQGITEKQRDTEIFFVLLCAFVGEDIYKGVSHEGTKGHKGLCGSLCSL